MPHRRSIAELVKATPPTRDRYVDFLRAASIAVVMLGHWLMAVIERRDGAWSTGNLLAEVEGMWIATWLFQVMPVFFFVGGFSNMVTLDAMERRGGGYAEFAAGRTWRLMKPVLVLLAIWLPLATTAQAAAGLSGDDLRVATTVVSQPLWFIGIYLIVTALAPPMRRLHRRFGGAVPVALAAAAMLVDLARFRGGVPMIGYLNFAFVWIFAHQLGFFYADGTLPGTRRRVLLTGAIVALAVLWALTQFGPYPRSMVGLPGEAVSNMNPPTVCLVALTAWQAALLIAAREHVTGWLANARFWGTVIAANAVIMTMFLWHLTALLVVAAIVLPLGFPQFDAGSGAWWVSRIPWLAMLVAVTSMFVIVLGRFERPGTLSPRRTDNPGAAWASVAAALIILGVCGFAVSGLADFVAPGGRSLLGIPVSPLINVLALAAGALLFRFSRQRVSDGDGGLPSRMRPRAAEVRPDTYITDRISDK